MGSYAAYTANERDAYKEECAALEAEVQRLRDALEYLEQNSWDESIDVEQVARQALKVSDD